MIEQLVSKLVNADRLLVASDFDGVLAPIVDDPAATTAVAESMAALRRLAAVADTAVAVVSGRDYALLQQLAAPAEAFTLVGSHGAELSTVRLDDGEQRIFDETVTELQLLAAEHPGLHIEVKALSVAAHFRRVTGDRAQATVAVEDVAGRWPGRVMNGKEVLELSLRHATKGTAIEQLQQDHVVTTTVYLGDDVTDEDVFVILGSNDVGIKVGDGPSAASNRLTDPAEVRVFLELLADGRTAAVAARV